MNTTSIVDFVEEILKRFRGCFSRQAAWTWFAILVVGFMVRSDHLGVTSVIRDLALAPGAYDSFMHFFRATSWCLDSIRQCWYRAVNDHAPLYREEGRCILVGDGVKQSKEARRMPGVKRLHQESEDSSKAAIIHGHMFGGLGILAGGPEHLSCIPLSLRLHDGLREAADWIGAKAISSASHVVQMIRNACEAAQVFGNAILLLDRYFLSADALKTLAECNAAQSAQVDIVTRAKTNCVGYEKPGPRKPGPGRPPKKGRAVKLKDLFESRKDDFTSTKATIYGKQQDLRYLCVNLLWGKKLYRELRFVLVDDGNSQSIFVSTDLTLDPMRIVRLYSRRYRIEHLFRELKQQIGAFCYRFWTKCLPKLSHFQKRSEPSPLDSVRNEHDRRMVLKTARAIEMHTMIACIAMGILQILCLKLTGRISPSELRYLRTPAKECISEATLMDWIRRNLFRLLHRKPNSSLSRLILAAQQEASSDQAA